MSADDLKSFELLSFLVESDREALEPLLETLELDPGQPLFQEGQESEGLVLVADGVLRVESRRAGPAGAVPKGGSLGALSLIALGERGVTAVAAEPTRVLLLTRTAFRRLVEDAPSVGCRLLEAVLADAAGQIRAGLERIAPTA